MLRINWTNGLTILSFNKKDIEIDLYCDLGAKRPGLNQCRKLLKAYEVALKTGNPPAIPFHIVRNLNLNNKNISATFGNEYKVFPGWECISLPDFVITGKDCGL